MIIDQNESSNLSTYRQVSAPSEAWTGTEFQRRSRIAAVVVGGEVRSASVVTLPATKMSLEERLFRATADAKVWTSRVAMHLDRESRDRFFRQIDSLHDPDEWSGEDSPVNIESYKGFIRAILFLKIDAKPALSLMPNGNLLASWYDDKGKISIEFMPGGRIRWFAKSVTGGETERATGTASLTRMRDVLLPYDGDRWFDAS
jgi:hypothetical protein